MGSASDFLDAPPSAASFLDGADAPPAAPPESSPIADAAKFMGGEAAGMIEGGAGAVWDTLKAGSALNAPVSLYHWATDPTGEWAKLKARGSAALQGVEDFMSSGPPVAGPYGATSKQVEQVEQQQRPGVEAFKKATPFEKGEMIGKPVGATVIGFAAPEATAASYGKVSSMLSRTEKLAAAAQETAQRAATVKGEAAKALSEHPFLGDQAAPQTKIEKDSALQAHRERKTAIQAELNAGIAEASRKMKSAEASVRAQGEKELAELEAKLSAAESSTPATHQVHQRAAQTAGLPPSYTLGGDRPPAGEMAREIAGPIVQAAEEKQAAAVQPWEDAKKHAKTLEGRGLYFETSPEGEALLKDLKRLVAGGIEGGSPGAAAPADVMAGLGGARPAAAAGTAGAVTADDVLRTTAQDLLRGLRGEDVGGVHHPVDFGVVHTNIRRLRDIQYSHPDKGYGSVARRHARDLADKVEDALKAYVGEENVPIGKYKEASEDINLWQSNLGQAISQREDIPYVGKDKNPPHTTAAVSLPGMISKDIQHANQLLGPENVTNIMEAHLSDELSTKNTSEAVRKYMNSSPWIDKVPGLTEKAYKYLQAVERAEGDVAALKRTTADLKAHIEATPGRIEKQIAEIRKTGEKEMGDARERASAAYVKAHDDMIARKAIASEIDSFMSATTPERVAADADKLIQSLSKLPGTSQEQINAVRAAARSAQDDINAARTLADKEARREKAVAAIKRTLITATIGGAAGGIVNKAMGTIH